jgi:hypothetical protein
MSKFVDAQCDDSGSGGQAIEGSDTNQDMFEDDGFVVNDDDEIEYMSDHDESLEYTTFTTPRLTQPRTLKSKNGRKRKHITSVGESSQHNNNMSPGGHHKGQPDDPATLAWMIHKLPYVDALYTGTVEW